MPPSNTTISLIKRASSSTVKAGGTVSFTIHWKNTGKTAAKNVVICDDLPNQMTFVSAKGSTFKNGKACWTRKSVAKGATLTFRVVARVDANVGNVKLVNVATATASNAKPANGQGPGSRSAQRAHSRRRRHRVGNHLGERCGTGRRTIPSSGGLAAFQGHSQVGSAAEHPPRTSWSCVLTALVHSRSLVGIFGG